MSEAPKLPPFSTVVQIEVPDPKGFGDDVKKLTGEFTIRRLPVTEMMKVVVEAARLNGGMAPEVVGEGTDNINSQIAQLKFSLVKAPEWFNLDEIYNLAAIKSVFKEVLKFEKSFRPSTSEQVPPAPEGGPA